MNRIVVSALVCVTTACICGGLAAKERVVVVPAHPDDLIPCFGTCLLSNDIFEWHVIEFTHGERGMGEQGDLPGASAAEVRRDNTLSGGEIEFSNALGNGIEIERR